MKTKKLIIIILIVNYGHFNLESQRGQTQKTLRFEHEQHIFRKTLWNDDLNMFIKNQPVIMNFELVIKW